ncbi:protein O-mannosyl-transferase family [Candidatus Latescibacterota bacterium]
MPNMKSESINTRWNYLIKGVFLIILAVYWWERMRGPGWGDSLLFIVSSLEGFSWSVNATGHFLYDNLNVLFVFLIPWVEPAALLTVISILYAMLTLVRIYQTAFILTENSFAAILATIGLAFSFTFWRQVEQVEVYTCACFLVTSAAYSILSDTKSGTYNNIIASGCWMGLAILVHIQTILLLPFYLLYIFQAWSKNRRQASISLIAVLFPFMLLIIPAIILSDYTIGSVFFGFNFQDEVLNFGFRSILTGTILSIAYVLYSFHIHIIAVVFGFVICFRNSARMFVLIMTGIIPVWVFALRYTVSDQYVFFLNAYIFLAIISTYGYDTLIQLIKGTRWKAVLLVLALLSSPVVYAVSLRVALHIPQIQGFHKHKEYKGGLSYFMWPGLRKTPEIFPVFRRQMQTGIPADIIDQELWNRLYNHALNYQKLIEERK